MRKAFPSKEEKKIGIVKLYSSRYCDKYSTLKKGRCFSDKLSEVGCKKNKSFGKLVGRSVKVR